MKFIKLAEGSFDKFHMKRPRVWFHCSLSIFKRWKKQHFLFRVLTFAELECDGVLQPDPRSGDDCHLLLHEGFAEKIVRSSFYIPSFPAQVFTMQSKALGITGQGPLSR